MRAPVVVALKCKTVRMVRTRAKNGPGSIERWYVTLDFGGVHKKLAVSSETAAWLQGRLK